MRKIRSFVVFIFTLVALSACGKPADSSTMEPSSTGDFPPSSIVEETYEVILPSVEGFEISANTLQPKVGEKVEVYVKNILPESRRLESLSMNGESLQGVHTNQSHTTLYQFVMPAKQNANITIEAVDVYRVTVAASLTRVLSLANIGDGLFAEGEMVTFTPTTYAGYYYQDIVAVDSDVTLQKDGDVYSFIMPAHVVTISATTGQNVYLVLYDDTDSNYSLSIENGYSALFNSRVSFKVTLHSVDLRLSEVKVDGEVLTPYAELSYHFVMPAHPVHIEVIYETLYKQIEAEDSEHFIAVLSTKTTEDGEKVAVTDTNVLSNQKIWVSAQDKEDNPTHDFVVDRITILGKETIEDTYVDLNIEVVRENEDFVFVTPENIRYLMIQLHEKEASVGFISGTFVGFQPNNSTGNNLGLSITAEGNIVADSYDGALTLVEENHYSLHYETELYGSTVAYDYEYFASPKGNAILEYNTGTEMFGSHSVPYKYAATKLFVSQDLYSSDYYSILMDEAGQFYSITSEGNIITNCYFDFVTSTMHWDVTWTLVSGQDGKTYGDVVEVFAQDGTSLAKMRLSGSNRNVQYGATQVN